MDLVAKLRAKAARMPAEGVVPFADYLSQATVPDCELPHYYVIHDGDGAFLDNEAQMQAKLESIAAAKGSPPVVYEGPESPCSREDADVQVYALHLGGELQPMLARLIELGLHFDTLRAADEATFMLSAKEKRIPAHGLFEAIEAVTDECSSGVEIQRYKGLGEMNPQQLFESTMDPERRTLRRVAVSDMVEADKIFTVLMGPEVEPRRNFIEKHALEATNIDV